MTVQITKEKLAELDETFAKAAKALPGVTRKKLFGCHAFYANEEIFGLIWKEGRIGLKLTDAADFDALMAEEDCLPWSIGPKKMSHWVLLSDGLSANSRFLKKWVKCAYEGAFGLT